MLFNLRSGNLLRQLGRIPVVGAAEHVRKRILRSIACVPNCLERGRRRSVLAAIEISLAHARVYRVSVAVFAVVFAKDLRSRIHIGAPAFGLGLRNHFCVQEDRLRVAPGTPEIESSIIAAVAYRDGCVIEYVAPVTRILRCGDVSAVSGHHELGSFEEHVAATANKVNRSIDFATFPVSAALLGVVGVLATQKPHILVDKLVAFVLLQRHLARRIA